MDNAVAVATPQALAAPAGFGARLPALPTRSKAALGGGLLVLLALVVGLLAWGGKGDYRVLYSNLSDKDGGAIIAQLSQMNVPYRHADGGAAILVPADKVHDVRLKLAAAGLPKGSTVGFEVMENSRFGLTQFQERLNFQRGLEGELTRSISSLAAVQAARVHLALPNQNGFFREQQKPSASVLLTLHPGRTLDRGQIAGIVHLVASSVPELNPKSVSILDQTGALLSGDPDKPANGMDAQQLQYVHQLEERYTRRILELLEPVVGRDNLRASVTADVDFSQTEATSEEFRPNQGPDGKPAVRSQQSSEMQGPAPGTPAGVPGAASNQPPVPATAPINGPAQGLQGAPGANGGGAASRRDAITNFEVDKTVRVTRAATGAVRRINAAVVVNHRAGPVGKDGKPSSQPLPAEELEKLTQLVRESVGFNEERGDSVRVINAPFRVEKVDTPDIPLWQQPWVLDLLRTLAVPVAALVVAAIVFLGMVRPALKTALAPPPEPEKPAAGGVVDEVVADAEALPGPDMNAPPALEGPAGVDDRLERARKLARENPAAVAGILRGWVSGEAAG